MLTDFIVIGGMKCGTTSLDYYLKAHPEIAMLSKEIDFFTRNYHMGLDWYESLFRTKSKDMKIFGETSVSYTKYPHYIGVPQRIASSNRNMKLIYVLRNPFTRTYSHYLHNVYAGIETDSFKEAIVKRPLYIQASLYYMQIREYLKFFPREQMLMLLLDDLKHNPTGSVKTVFGFLQVDEQFIPPNISEVKHQTKKKRGKDRLITNAIKKLPFYNRVNDTIPDNLKQVAGLLLKKRIEAPSPNPQEIDENTKGLIIEDMAKLSEVLRRDLSFWIDD